MLGMSTALRLAYPRTRAPWDSALNATLRHFSCPLCDKVYYNKSSLKKHIRLHHGQFYDGKTADGIREGVDLAAARRAQDAAAVAAAVTQQIQQQHDEQQQHLPPPQQHVQHVEIQHATAVIPM